MTAAFIREAARPVIPAWHVHVCDTCARSIMRLVTGSWSHVSDFTDLVGDHVPMPRRFDAD